MNELPAIHNSEAAREVGLTMTVNRFVLLAGALFAVRRMYDAFRLEARHSRDDETRKGVYQQESVNLAFQGQMLREALEETPLPVLMALQAAGLDSLLLSVSPKFASADFPSGDAGSDQNRNLVPKSAGASSSLSSAAAESTAVNRTGGELRHRTIPGLRNTGTPVAGASERLIEHPVADSAAAAEESNP